MRTVLLAFVLLVLAGGSASADPVQCEKQLVKQLARLRTVQLKALAKCLDRDNVLQTHGPCPDSGRVQVARDNLVAAIGRNCSLADASALAFPADCNLDIPDSPAETACSGLPVSTVPEFAQCVACWTEARIRHYAALLYPSHVTDLCGADLGNSSTCSDLSCGTAQVPWVPFFYQFPLPDQRDLGDTRENECQRAIGKAGIRYLLMREKIFEKKCALLGRTHAECLGDLAVQALLDKAEAKKVTTVKDKCGPYRSPQAGTPFCCKTTGNACIGLLNPATTRDDCITAGGSVQEGSYCGGDNECHWNDQFVTWWENCPLQISIGDSDCVIQAVETLEDLIACVDAAADLTVDRLMCHQFRGAADWPCPSPSAAFLD